MIKTKQELLNHFSDINEKYNNPFMYQTLSNMIDALLEQEPCEDCISRKRVIMLIDEATEKYPYKIIGLPDTYSNYNQGWADACDWLYANIESDNLPNVKPQRAKGYWNFVGDNMFECTCCGNTYTQDELKAWRHRNYEPIFPNFCPNCGAEMRGEEE